ncbi:MAG TPA: tRNA lysidine(34) synthetase TilS [Thermoanaerobaculia bacterium]|nr:tRNA lysidine(34) synthetase TilS [Thermoanaerobaculia bacterium]
MRATEILSTLEAFFRVEAPLEPGDGLIAAFSGGPDSTALLLGLARLAERRRCRLLAAHLDHGMDAGSAERSEAAQRLAERLGVPFVTARREVLRLRQSGESPEAAARRVRYEHLEEVRRNAGARWIATAHHRDDQAETVALRMLFGSGLEGLGGIRPVQGAVVRPLLRIARTDLLAMVQAAGVEAVQDPTNLDLRTPRNRVRHLLLPSLSREAGEGRGGGLPDQLARLADRARAASARIERHLSGCLNVEETEDGVAIRRGSLFRLPAELLPFALAWLHRRAGSPRPAGSAARAELLRQLRARDGAGCDCGGGWRWEIGGELLTLHRPAAADKRMAGFSYTLEASGGP